MSDMDQYRELFLVESLKHLEAAEAALTAEGGLGRGEIDGVFREIHSLKGMAASMGFRPLTELAHLLEDRLHGWRGQTSGPGPEDTALCLRVCDRLADMRLDIASGGDGNLWREDLEAALRGALGAEPDPKAENQGTLRVRLEIDPECGSPSARAYLILLRFRELDGSALSDPPEEAMLRGEVLSSIELSLSGVSREDVEQVCDTLTEVAAVSFPSEGGVTPRRRADVSVPPTPPEGRPDEDFRLRSLEAVPAPVRLLDEFVDLVGEMTLSRNRLDEAARALGSEALSEEVIRLGALIRTFQDRVMGLRMLPFSLVSGGLKRLVREVAGRLGREVDLRVSGEEIGMDKSILLQISDPLSHLLRNSLDHGIEPPDERRRRGKPSAGLVELRAVRAKNQVEVTVADDGRGIDAETVRLKAVEAGILDDEESRNLPTQSILACLFRPGFSTRTEVTEVSGRGVGLDVVKRKVEALGGGIELTSSPGSGTRFRLTLPRSVAIVPVLTVEVGANVVAIPVAAISSTVEASTGDVLDGEGGRVLLTDRGRVPVVSLAQVLKMEGNRRKERRPFVLLQDASGTTALGVDRFLREEDLYVKPLRGPLHRLPGVSGYSMMGDGRLVFLLDPATLLGG